MIASEGTLNPDVDEADTNEKRLPAILFISNSPFVLYSSALSFGTANQL